MDKSSDVGGHPECPVTSASTLKPLARPFDAISPTGSYPLSTAPAKRQRTAPISMLRFEAADRANRPDRARQIGSGPAVFDPYRQSHYIILNEHRPEFRPDQFFESFWLKLETALEAIFRDARLDTSVQDLYMGIENICRQGNAAALYTKLTKHCERCILQRQQRLLDDHGAAIRSGGDSDSIEALNAVLALWQEWRTRVAAVSSVFAFVDQYYASRNSLPLVLDMGIDLFRKHIFSVPDIQSTVIRGTCLLVSRQRNGLGDNKDAFREVTRMFRYLSVYQQVFEPAFLGVSQEFIRNWVSTHTQTFSLPAYTKGALTLIEDELQRCDLLALSKSTRWSLISLLDKHLIEMQKERLVDAEEFGSFLDQNRLDDIKNLFDLLRRVKLEGELSEPLAQWIQDAGSPILLQPENHNQMVYMLVSMKTKLDTIWDQCFDRDREIGNRLTSSFTKVVNSRPRNSHGRPLPSKLPEMISKYFDFVLKGGVPVFPDHIARPSAEPGADSGTAAKTNSPTVEANNPLNTDTPEEADTKLLGYIQEGFDVFRYLEGKNVVERIYRTDLARRLLLNRHANSKGEKYVMDRFRSECGDSFVEGMDLMLQDIIRARNETINNPALSRPRSRPARAIDFSAVVLSSAAWPTYPDIEVKLPPKLKDEHDRFEREYKATNSKHSVFWKHGLAQCVVKAHFPQGSKELLVTGFQAIVLYQFADVKGDGQVSYSTLHRTTGLPEAELKRTLQSLASAKIRPLTKHPRGRDVATTDMFSVNDGFTHERYRVKISQIQHRDESGSSGTGSGTTGSGGGSGSGAGAGRGDDANSDIDEDDSEDRMMELQSAIMRRLKAKKVIGRTELVAETLGTVRYPGPNTETKIGVALDKLYERDMVGKQTDGQYTWDI